MTVRTAGTRRWAVAALLLALLITARPQAQGGAVAPASPQTTRPSEQAAPLPAGGRNLFLAPETVRRSREGEGGRLGGPGGLSGSSPGRAMFPPPPPMPGLPLPPSLFPAAPRGGEGSGASGQPFLPPVRPALLGVVAGDDPQAILEHDGQVVVARRGDQTPWGVLVEVGLVRTEWRGRVVVVDASAVLKTKAGKMTLYVSIGGIRRFL